MDLTVLDILSVNDKDFSISIMAFLGIQWAEPRLFKSKNNKNKNKNKRGKNNNRGNGDDDDEEFDGGSFYQQRQEGLNSRYKNSSRMVPVDPQFLEKVPELQGWIIHLFFI